jgi:hypothetical protein
VRVVWLVGRGLEAQAQGDTGRLRITEESGPDERSPTMEMLIIVLALCLLGTLAIMFGADSRGGVRSREDEAAGYGMSWDAGVRG